MKKNYKIRLLVIFFFCVSFFFSFGNNDAFSSTMGKYRWKVATMAPKGIGWSKQFEEIILPGVAASSDGALRLKILWGGVMGDDKDYIKKMGIGQIDGAGLTAQGATIACPEFAVLELPFLFNNYDEVDYVRARMQPTFEYYFSQYGFKLLFWIDQDFDQMYSVKSRLETPEDLANATFVSWYGPVEQALFNALGAKSTSFNLGNIPNEIREGRADSLIAPAVWIVGAQLYSIVKYVNTMKVRYSPAAILVTEKAWNSIPEEYGRRFMEKRDSLLAAFAKATREDNKLSLQAMVKYGVKDAKPTLSDMKIIRKKAMSLYGELAGDVYPTGLLMEINRYLGEFRGTAPQNYVKKKNILTFSVEKPEKRSAEKAVKKTGQAEKKTAVQKIKKKKRQASWMERKRRIALVQTKLKGLGYYNSTVDGISGPITRRGIRNFQKDNNMAVTGAIDNKLLKALSEGE